MRHRLPACRRRRQVVERLDRRPDGAGELIGLAAHLLQAGHPPLELSRICCLLLLIVSAMLLVPCWAVFLRWRPRSSPASFSASTRCDWWVPTKAGRAAWVLA